MMWETTAVLDLSSSYDEVFSRIYGWFIWFVVLLSSDGNFAFGSMGDISSRSSTLPFNDFTDDFFLEETLFLFELTCDLENCLDFRVHYFDEGWFCNY